MYIIPPTSTRLFLKSLSSPLTPPIYFLRPLLKPYQTSTMSSSKAIRVENHTIPTAQTKITLAGKVEVSPFALGCWSWGDSGIWGWTPDAEADAKQAFDKTFQHGINFFDTAEIYGNGESERVISRFRDSCDEETKNNLVITTKYLPSRSRTSFPSSLIDALKASLKRLNMDQVDLYQIHAPIHAQSIETIGDALAEAVKLGLTKTVGVSNYSSEQVTRMYKHLKEKHGIQLASNQVEYSLLRTLPEKSGLIETCHNLGVAVLAYSPLGMGRLTGKYSASNPPPSGRSFSNYSMSEIDPLVDVARRIAEAHKVSVSAVALNWVICKGAIPLSGAKNAKQAEQNAQALGWRLTDEEIHELESRSIEGTNTEHWQNG